MIRDPYRDPGLPHGYDPLLFQKSPEQPLGTSADATEPVGLQDPLARPALRQGGLKVRSFLVLFPQVTLWEMEISLHT